MSGWVGVITDIGRYALVRSIVESETLELNAVQIGTGYVTPANMRSAVQLQTQVGTGFIRQKKEVDGGVRIIVEIQAQQSAVTVKEVGVFGTIDGSNVLIALYQKQDGIEVPAASVFPDYSYRLSAMWALDNTGTLSVTVDPSALVTVGDLEDALETVVALDQGSSNVGKVLVVGEDGKVTLETWPPANGEEF